MKTKLEWSEDARPLLGNCWGNPYIYGAQHAGEIDRGYNWEGFRPVGRLAEKLRTREMRSCTGGAFTTYGVNDRLTLRGWNGEATEERNLGFRPVGRFKLHHTALGGCVFRRGTSSIDRSRRFFDIETVEEVGFRVTGRM